MKILDAACTARVLHDIVTHNRLAWQLAEAWDKQHQDDMPIVLACEKLLNDWKKMVWKNKLVGIVQDIQGLTIGGIILTFALLVASDFNYAWLYMSTSILLAILLYPLIGLARKLERELVDYCKLGVPLRNAHCAIRDVYDEYKDYGDVHVLLQLLDDMCLKIVKLEKLGQEGVKFINPFPTSNYYVPLQLIDLKVLRSRFVSLVTNISSFGLTTGDLKVHFDAAQNKWNKLAANGHLMTDFQI